MRDSSWTHLGGRGFVATGDRSSLSSTTQLTQQPHRDLCGERTIPTLLSPGSSRHSTGSHTRYSSSETRFKMLKHWKSFQVLQQIFVVSHRTEQLRDYITRLNTLRSGDICYSTHSLDHSSLSLPPVSSVEVRERPKDSRIDPVVSPDLLTFCVTICAIIASTRSLH